MTILMVMRHRGGTRVIALFPATTVLRPTLLDMVVWYGDSNQRYRHLHFFNGACMARRDPRGIHPQIHLSHKFRMRALCILQCSPQNSMSTCRLCRQWVSLHLLYALRVGLAPRLARLFAPYAPPTPRQYRLPTVTATRVGIPEGS
jgi:hypothetical protein